MVTDFPPFDVGALEIGVRLQAAPYHALSPVALRIENVFKAEVVLVRFFRIGLQAPVFVDAESPAVVLLSFPDFAGRCRRKDNPVRSLAQCRNGKPCALLRPPASGSSRCPHPPECTLYQAASLRPGTKRPPATVGFATPAAVSEM